MTSIIVNRKDQLQIYILPPFHYTAMIMSKQLAFTLIVASVLQCSAFVSPASRLSIQTPHKTSSRTFIPNPKTMNRIISPSSLQMGYNLPPGGGQDPKDSVASILQPALAIAATVLFFISPLGSIFFAITNSIVLLLILTPLLAASAFQIWQTFYTIEAPCPSCGAPARVLKDEEAGPNMCLNCGSLLRANLNKDGVELCNNPNDIYDESSRLSSLFDLFKGDDAEGIFNQQKEFTPTNFDDGKKDKKRRETTIIDVDVTNDD